MTTPKPMDPERLDVVISAWKNKMQRLEKRLRYEWKPIQKGNASEESSNG
jgi:hypothetical protein